MSGKKPEYNEAMKLYRTFSFLILFFFLSSCGGNGKQPAPTAPGSSFEIFRYEGFQAVVPDWDESPELDEASVLSLYKDGQFIAVNRYQHLPEIFANEFKAFVEEDPDAYLVLESELNGKPFFEFTTRENNQTMRLNAILDYCQGYTYALIAGGRDTVRNARLFEEVLKSSSCQDPL